MLFSAPAADTYPSVLIILKDRYTKQSSRILFFEALVADLLHHLLLIIQGDTRTKNMITVYFCFKGRRQWRICLATLIVFEKYIKPNNLFYVQMCSPPAGIFFLFWCCCLKKTLASIYHSCSFSICDFLDTRNEFLAFINVWLNRYFSKHK